MDVDSLKILFCLYLIVQMHHVAQGCIRKEYSTIGSYLILRSNLQHQAIIPSYRLNCLSEVCGNITDWVIHAYTYESRRRRDVDELTRDSRSTNNPAVPSPLLGIQVWRPLPPLNQSTGAGCYSLVGSQGISSIPPDSNYLLLTPDPFHQHGIPFQSGDVLGFYVDIPDTDEYDGIEIHRTSSIETVWYAENEVASRMPTLYSVGTSPPADLSASRDVAPAITIAITTYSCPGPPSLSTQSLTTSLSRPAISISTSSFISPSMTLSSTMTATTLSSTMTAATVSNSLLTTQVPHTTNEPLLPMLTNIGGTSDGLPTPPRPTVDVTGSGGDINIIANTITTDPLLPIEVSDSGNNLGELVAGTIVAILAVLVLAVLLVITIIFIFKRRVGKRTDSFGVVHTRIGFSNQTYGRLDNEFETSYESIDTSPETTVPLPRVRYSPSSDTLYTQQPQDSESNINSTGTLVNRGSQVYHDIGPNISNLFDLTSTGTDAQSDHTYQYIEAGTIGIESNNIYEDQNQPNFGGVQYSELNSTTDIFDSTGIYVPTWEERSSFEGHYDMQEIKVYNRLKFFKEEKVYWAPASTALDLYSQLASKKYREIPRNQIRILNKLGSGQFGEVCKAVWSISGTTKELAIKTLRAELPEEEKVRFLQEAAIMGQFSHPNVIKLYGVVTVGDPMMICLELMAHGDLRCHLCSLNPHTWNIKELEVQFLHFSKQIAAGMEYLANKSFIHRDLAARNILLDETLTCKIGDFGMARDLMDETYYTAHSNGAKIPIKWTAPEALFYKKYSTNSDVWSYGMVLFEIWSVGKKPFSQFSNSQVLKQINLGYNQPPPPGCPRVIYQLMVDCWHPVHSQRPPFSKISHYLSTKSSDALLVWMEEDNTVICSKARQLGEPLAEAKDLYKDLQEAYLQLENLQLK